MIKCNNCGTEFNEEVKICPECGASDFIYDYIVVGIDADSNGDLEYYQCEDKDVSVNDFVTIYGLFGEHLVFDVQFVDPATTTLPIHPTYLARKVVRAHESNEDYVQRRIRFKEGGYQVRYYRDDKYEIKELHKHEALEIFRISFLVFGWISVVVLAWAMFAIIPLGIIGFILSAFGVDASGVWFYIVVFPGTTALLFTLSALCKEQERINDVKYVKYKIESLGDKVVSFDTWRLNIVYNKQGQIKTLTSKERLFKRRING